MQVAKVPAKFIIKGRVIRHHPPSVADFTRRFCASCQQSISTKLQLTCSKCLQPATEFVFMFALEVTDGFDQICIIVAHQDAIRFLNGMVASDLHRDLASYKYLADCMSRLLASSTPMSFCIKSYQVGSERRYRVFDTLLAIQ